MADKDVDSAYLVREMKGIPKDLLKIFAPSTIKEIALYVKNIMSWRKKSYERHKAYHLYRIHRNDLPLKARKYSLREIEIAVAILKLKEKNKYKDSDNPLGDNYGA